MLAINFAAGARRGHARARPRRHRGRGGGRVRHPPAPRREPALRPRRRRPAHLLGGGVRRHHRVRLADGRDVHRPAVPAERARLLDTLEAGAAILPAAVVHGARRAALGQARRGARRALHAARRLRVLPARLPHDARCSGTTAASYWQVGLGYALVGAGVGFAGTPASHSLTGSVPVRARGHGVGHRRPPARPRRGDHAVDPRRAAHRRATRRRSPSAIAVVAERATRSRAATRERSSRSRSRARRTPPSSTRSTRSRSPPRRKQSFVDGQDWAYIAGHHRDRRSAPRSCSSCSRSTTTRSSCSPSTSAEDDRERGASPRRGDLAHADLR